MKVSKITPLILCITLISCLNFTSAHKEEEIPLLAENIEIPEDCILITNGVDGNIFVSKNIITLMIANILGEELNADITKLDSFKILFPGASYEMLNFIAMSLKSFYDIINNKCKEIGCIKNCIYEPLINSLFNWQQKNRDEMHKFFRAALRSIEVFQNAAFTNGKNSLKLSKQIIVRLLRYTVGIKKRNEIITMPLLGLSEMFDLAAAILMIDLTKNSIKYGDTKVAVVAFVLSVVTLAVFIFFITYGPYHFVQSGRNFKTIDQYIYNKEIYADKPSCYKAEIIEELKQKFGNKMFSVFVEAFKVFAEKYIEEVD